VPRIRNSGAASGARRIVARAPGKLAVLGEYAVLAGAPALVLAVDRHCIARIEASRDDRCSLETRFPDSMSVEVEAGRATGVALVDIVAEGFPGGQGPARPWKGVLDSRELFVGSHKLGLGSSAAALCAWAGAWAAWSGDVAPDREWPSLQSLVELHRRFQGGSGSGLDVAAAYTGGVIEFRLKDGTLPHVGSVRLPNSVGFAGIFAGRSASTPDLVARYRRWRLDRPAQAAERQRVMEDIAEGGCAAARQDDAGKFLRAVDLYGRQLDVLGQAIGVDIVTAEHRAIGEHARRFGVTYKVSGAGGGDLGLALAADAEALRAFERAVGKAGYRVVELHLDRQGLNVEEQAE
jgi:phosphomevalonate kinase